MRKNIVSKRILNHLATKMSPRHLRSIRVVSSALALLLLVTVFVSAQTPSPQKPKSEFFKGKKVAAGQVLVKFRQATTAQNIDQAKRSIDADTDRKVGKTGVRLLRSRSKDTATLIRELSARSDVAYVEPNYVISVSAVPNDPSFSQVWGLQNTGQDIGGTAGTSGADISAMTAWEVSTGSRQNVVAIVDTGVDYTHADLAANMWSAPAAFTVNIGGQTIRCEAGTHGFNAITRTCDPMDDYGHGTHVAGTIGAVGNNSVGISGVNQTASMMGLKFLDATGSGTLADAIDAIDFAIQAKQALGAAANVRVLSNSWGWNGELSQALLDEINRANASNMLFVAGAGNGGDDYVSDNNDASPFYPGSYNAPNVISVAANDNNDLLASFSNYGAASVHLGAPGVLVLSTTLGGSYDYWSGTSMATPHVSGAAALVLSRCTLDTASLKTNLLNNVDPTGSLYGSTISGGRLNVNRAIRACAVNNAPTVSLTTPAGGTTFTAPANITLGANAADSDGQISRVEFYAGTQLVGSTATSPYNVTWNNVAAGRYTLTAVATDDKGLGTTSSAVSITVNQPPTASAGGPYSGTTGQALQFNGSGSRDLDGTITRYQWNFGNGASATGATTSYTYPATGTYTVTLTITDNNGAISNAKTTATISLAPPAAPSGLIASSLRSGEATLRWSDRSTNEQSFKIERSTSSSTGFVQVATLGANQTSYTERGLQRKRTYYYRVRAANSGGNSAYSNTASVSIK